MKLILIALFTCTTCFLTPVILVEVSASEADDNISSKRGRIVHTSRTGKSCTTSQCEYRSGWDWMVCDINSKCCTSTCVYSRTSNKYWCWVSERSRRWDYCDPGVPYYKTNSDGSIQEYKPLLPEETSRHLSINRLPCMNGERCNLDCNIFGFKCGEMHCKTSDGEKHCCATKCKRRKTWLKTYWWCKISTLRDTDYWDYCTEGAPYYELSYDGTYIERLSS